MRPCTNGIRMHVMKGGGLWDCGIYMRIFIKPDRTHAMIYTVRAIRFSGWVSSTVP